ncbi:MAG TPA: NAD(P)-dependent oxidoreductase, partial [Negativicutes bacterium]|nr:NAD(P)-dependent oxidoreductase [Negativicutes bacterium]
MKIVVLDAVSLSERQVNQLKSIGDATIFTDNPNFEDEIINRAGNAEILICGWTNISRKIMMKLPKLRMISLWATGYDYIDIEAAKELGIVVSNVPAYARNAVAELAVGLMLAVLRHIPEADSDYRRSKSLQWERFQGMELTGKTIGIIGTGAIGGKVARIAKGFDMNILANDLHINEQLVEEVGVKYVEFNSLISESDIITLHIGLGPSTVNLIDKYCFERMKKSAILINTARPGLVNQEHLSRALREGQILGAGLDELDTNSKSAEEIIRLPNVVLTPHMGFNTIEAVKTKTDIC